MHSDPQPSLGRPLSILSRHLHTYLGRELASLGIGAGQVPILVCLWRRDGITQEEIALETKTDKGATARTIRRLVEEGYITREENPNDRRCYRVCLTESGRKVEPEVRRVLSAWTQAVGAGLSDRERLLLLDVLERMTGNAERLLSSLEGDHVE
jgi:DNA-binding MarR family transcriptional regulator